MAEGEVSGTSKAKYYFCTSQASKMSTDLLKKKKTWGGGGAEELEFVVEGEVSVENVRRDEHEPVH